MADSSSPMDPTKKSLEVFQPQHKLDLPESRKWFQRSHENSSILHYMRIPVFSFSLMLVAWFHFCWLNYFTPHLPSSYHKTFVISCHKQICGIQALLVQPCPWILNRPGTESKYKTFPSTKVWESLGARVSFSPAGCYKTTKDLLCDKCNIFL